MSTISTNHLTFRRLLPLSWLLFAAAFQTFTWRSSCTCCITRGAFASIAVACFALSIYLAWLAFLPISRCHTVTSAAVHHAINWISYIAGYFAAKSLQKTTSHIRSTQEACLQKLIKDNAETEFGQKMGFSSIKDRDDYRRHIPLTSYEDYADYVKRIEKGEQNLLTKAPVVRLTVSSGTTGKVKHLPNTGYHEMAIAWGFGLPFMYRLSKVSKRPLSPLKVCDFSFAPNWRYTENGLPIGPVSASTAKKMPYPLAVTQMTPPEAKALMSEPAQMYLHLYYALYDRELGFIGSTFGGTLLAGLEFFRKNYQKLADDIRSGTISNHFDIPDYVYRRLQPLPADPVRAKEIEEECKTGFESIVPRLWPRLENAWCVITGSHAIFADRIKYFLGPNLPVLSSYYMSSEGPLAIAHDAKQDANYTYTLMPTWCFFEFIPEEELLAKSADEKGGISTLFMDQVEKGKRYELVLSSFNGFYRYRLGDIVKVVDFFNEAPVVEFCSRTGSILDVRGEKTTEDMVLQAVRETKWPENGRVIEFTTTDCVSLAAACPNDFDADDGLSYVLFVEIDKLLRALNNMEETAAFDSALCNASYPYKSFRVKGAIQMPKIYNVQTGTFDRMKQMALERNGSTSNQYKTPRYIKNSELLRFLFKQAY